MSPHLDDAVLSCCYFLRANPQVTVVTVFTDTDDDPRNVPERLDQFGQEERDKYEKRRSEDESALEELQATREWLGLSDSKLTGESKDSGPIVDRLRPVLKRVGPASVLLPLGIEHSDHVTVNEACLRIAVDCKAQDVAFYLYTDVPYAQTYPSVYCERLTQVGKTVRTVFDPEYITPEPIDLKRNTFARHYCTQFRPLQVGQIGFEAGMVAPEEYRRITP